MDRMVSISEARAELGALVTEAAEHEVFLVRHSKRVAVILDADKYERLLDRVEDLEDALSVHNAEGDTVPFVPTEEHAHA